MVNNELEKLIGFRVTLKQYKELKKIKCLSEYIRSKLFDDPVNKTRD